uniref:Secreted protein n=1 Tax=Setaria viridis TaxID=4556 RepID=A0A4U6UK80_SETVI|nr:hypothetical protein SEVIR_5G319300v2 [Setaria viridis]
MVTAILTLGLGFGFCWWVVLACVEVSCTDCDALLERRGRELMVCFLVHGEELIERRVAIGCFSGEGTKRGRWHAKIMGAGVQLGEEEENAAVVVWSEGEEEEQLERNPWHERHPDDVPQNELTPM